MAGLSATGTSQPGGPGVQVPLVREAGRVLGCFQVGGAGRRRVPGHFQQVGAHRVEAVPGGQAGVGGEVGEQFEAGLRAVHHGGGDRVVERDDGLSDACRSSRRGRGSAASRSPRRPGLRRGRRRWRPAAGTGRAGAGAAWR